MIFTVEFDTQIKVGDDLQISLSKGMTGQKIARESLEEQPDYPNIEYHPDNPKIKVRTNNYILLEGKIRTTFEFEGDAFSEADLEQCKALNDNVEKSSPKYIRIDDMAKGISGYEYEQDYVANEWVDNAGKWELDTPKAGLEILQDDTVLMCCLLGTNGWHFKYIDVPGGGGTQTVQKSHEHCYLLAGNTVDIKIPHPDIINDFKEVTIDRHTIKKLVSPTEATITNNGDTACRVVMICKN